MIVFIHVNNDFSGSPKILRDIISVANKNGIPSKCYFSSASKDGFLSSLNVDTKLYWYRRSSNRAVTFINLVLSQMILFVKLFLDRDIGDGDVIYVNTLLPFGANLYALITGKKVICHIHEISLTPPIFMNSLLLLNRWTSRLNIFVSDTHFEILNLCLVPHVIIPNSLDDDMVNLGADTEYTHKSMGMFRVLMVSSPTRYKGIDEFCTAAAQLTHLKDVRFDLVLNASSDVVTPLLEQLAPPENVMLHAAVSQIECFYEEASVLLNLSRPDMWVETFGMTILEAMAFGVPVIVPPVGGPVELVSNGVEGFLLDSRDLDGICEKILLLYNDPVLCKQLSDSGKRKAQLYRYSVFEEKLMRVFSGEADR